MKEKVIFQLVDVSAVIPPKTPSRVTQMQIEAIQFANVNVTVPLATVGYNKNFEMEVRLHSNEAVYWACKEAGLEMMAVFVVGKEDIEVLLNQL